MNASFSILQKLKDQFLESVPNKADYHVAFAPLAFPLTSEDFFFLKDNTSDETGDATRTWYKEQFEFAQMSNSVLKKPYIWSMNGDSLLYNLYKDLLQEAATISPDFLTNEEKKKVRMAKKILFKGGVILRSTQNIKSIINSTWIVRKQ